MPLHQAFHLFSRNAPACGDAVHLGDWAIHCHKSHHTMNAMGHDERNFIGVSKKDLAKAVGKLAPDAMVMGSTGMAMGEMEMPMPDNTLMMMSGSGQFGPIEMGGMFTVLKVREGLAAGDFSDPGAYVVDESRRARRVSSDPDFGSPHRRSPYAGTTPNAPAGESDDHAQHHHHGSEAQ